MWGAHVLPDGRYRLAVTARAAGKTVTKAADVVVDRTLAGLQSSLPVISPTGDGVNDTVTVLLRPRTERPCSARDHERRIRRRHAVRRAVAVDPRDPLGRGRQEFGVSRCRTRAHTSRWSPSHRWARRHQLSLPLTIDTIPPVLTLLDARTLKFSLNEPAAVTVVVNQKTRLVKNAPGHVHGRLLRHGDRIDRRGAGRRRERQCSRHRLTAPRAVAPLEAVEDLDQQLEPVSSTAPAPGHGAEPTLTPMPSTTRSPASARMPATFNRPRARRSGP